MGRANERPSDKGGLKGKSEWKSNDGGQGPAMWDSLAGGFPGG